MRDYRRERRLYYGYGSASSVTPLQQKHRREMRSRQLAREKVKATRRVSTTQDVHHVNGRPLDNRMSNLKVTSRHATRAKNKHHSSQ